MAWPAVLETFFVAFVSLVDSFMVSTLGSYAVAAVGLTTQPRLVGMSLFMAANVSISALVARRKGEDRKKDANQIFTTFLVFIIIAAIVTSIAMVVWADPLIRFCGSEADTHESAVVYFKIIMSGMIFNVIQTGVNGAQRGAGNTRITMRTNLVSNTVNIIFNYLLIGGNFGFPALGIRGAAIATVLGYAIASIMSLRSVWKEDSFISILYILKERVKPCMSALRDIIHVGYGVFAERLLMRVGLMSTSIMAASQGTAAMAAHQVGMNMMTLSFSFGEGLQATAVALIGYSLGRKDAELAKRYGRICQVIGGGISVILAVVYLFGGRGMYMLFFREPEIVDIGVNIARIMILIVVVQVSQVIYMGCLRGAGDTLFTATVSTVSIVFIRTIASWFFAYVCNLGIIGIWMGTLMDQVVRLIMSSIRFKRGKWTQIKI